MLEIVIGLGVLIGGVLLLLGVLWLVFMFGPFICAAGIAAMLVGFCGIFGSLIASGGDEPPTWVIATAFCGLAAMMLGMIGVDDG